MRLTNSILVLQDKLSRKIKCKFFILVYLYFFDKIKTLFRNKHITRVFLNIYSKNGNMTSVE